jgi:N-methylhydantoinase A
MAYYLGVDIGGTFTDCVAVDAAGRVFEAKVPSTHHTSPVEGVLAGLDRLAEEAGLSNGQIFEGADRLSHGTTIGTNLIVERKGARVALLATAGHGDALGMMRGNGRTAGAPADQVFSVHATSKPAPLVDPQRVCQIGERVAVDGEVVAPLNEEDTRRRLEELLTDNDVDAVAVALLWSFRNPEHERRLRELVNELAPGTFISISSEVSPRQGEYERTVATVLNSYVGPDSARYLGELADALRERGLHRAPFIMQANGGVVPVDVAQRFPVQTIGSGPAGGLAGATQVAAVSGHANVIATDMGGTSFEVGLVVGGQPVLSSEQVVDQHAFHMPQLDVRSIACGGGSIAAFDEHGGTLRVGPDSAGADPGPACYGRGSKPTVTDADVVLGLIDPDRFLGGRMPLDAEAARQAVETVGAPLGLTPEDAAAGIVHINNQKAALLIRQRTVEQGLDPREFVLYAYGGAGPVHAFGFADELGVRQVVIPLGNGASTLSAYGIAATDAVRLFERQCSLFAPFDADALAALIDALEVEALTALKDSGLDPATVIFERVAVMRYAEQFLHELPVAIDPGPIDEAACERLAESFRREYARLYGEGAQAIFQAVEVFGIRVAARVPLGFPTVAGEPEPPSHNGRAITSDQVRQVYWPEERAWVPTAVYDGRDLTTGAALNGPAVVELPHTTVAVAAGQRLSADSVGNLVLTIG